MKLKRSITLLVTTVMLLGLMGIFSSCGNGGTVKAEVIDGKYSPTIKVTWAYPFIGANQETVDHHKDANGNPDWTDADTSWTRLAKSNYGIDLILEWDVHEAGAYMARLDNAIILGEIPDYLNCLYQNYATNYISKLYLAELIQPIGETIELYACQDYKDSIEYVGEQVFYSSTFGGEIYSIPQITLGTSKNSVWWIRQDWLDAVNKSIPDNWEDFKDVMIAFGNQDPDGDGQKNTYGLGLNLLNAGVNNNVLFNTFGAFPGQWVLNNDTGKLEYGSIQPEIKTVLSELRDLYARGGIYPLTEDTNALYAGYTGVVNGKVGCLEATTNYVNVFKNLKQQNSNVEFNSILLFMADGSDPVVSSAPNTFRQYVVSKECKYPAVPVLLINMCCEISAASEDDIAIQKEYISTTDEKGTFEYHHLAPAATQRLNNGSSSITTRVKEALETEDESVLLPSDRQIYDNIRDYLDNGNINNWYYERMYGIDGANFKVESANYGRFVTLFQGTDTQSMLEFQSDLNTMLTIGFVQIIIGDVELDNFDILVESWYEQGGNEITADVNAWYSEMIG